MCSCDCCCISSGPISNRKCIELTQEHRRRLGNIVSVLVNLMIDGMIMHAGDRRGLLLTARISVLEPSASKVLVFLVDVEREIGKVCLQPVGHVDTRGTSANADDS